MNGETIITAENIGLAAEVICAELPIKMMHRADGAGEDGGEGAGGDDMNDRVLYYRLEDGKRVYVRELHFLGSLQLNMRTTMNRDEAFDFQKGQDYLTFSLLLQSLGYMEETDHE